MLGLSLKRALFEQHNQILLPLQTNIFVTVQGTLNIPSQRKLVKKQSITQADFHLMNLADLLDIGWLSRHKVKKNICLRIRHLVLKENLNALIHDFEYIDHELHKHFLTSSPLPNPNTSIKGLGDVDYGLILEPIKRVIFVDEEVKIDI